MPEEIVNRVAQSGLVDLDPADFYPKFEIIELDIKPWLFQGLILKEGEFRASLKSHDWSVYNKQNVVVYCSVDAIIPQWAYMLIAAHLEPIDCHFFLGSKDDFVKEWMKGDIESYDFAQHDNARVVVKGCGEYPIPDTAYLQITKGLMPHAKSIMFGEACSTVPIFKRTK